MQVAPDGYPPSSTINRQQLTPPASVKEEDYASKLYRQRSVSDPREDDYYFYHTGRGMTSRRGSMQSIGKRPEDESKASEQVRLPSIASLLAVVERILPSKNQVDRLAQAPPPPPPQHPYPTPREPQPSRFPSGEPLPPYYSPPHTYPHIPPRRPSIFSAYSSSPTPSSPQIHSYGPSYHSFHPPHQTGVTPNRTPSPPYPPRHIHIPPNYPTTYIQPRPPPSAFLPPYRGHQTRFALTHRTNSASPAERYMCHECNKSFSRPSSLRIHTFSHTGEKPFVCPEPGCTKRFSVRSNMRRHMKVHTEQQGSGATGGGGSTGGERESAKDDDDGISETSGGTSTGHDIPLRSRQGSRSSI
jgi:hypothetical protein